MKESINVRSSCRLRSHPSPTILFVCARLFITSSERRCYVVIRDVLLLVPVAVGVQAELYCVKMTSQASAFPRLCGPGIKAGPRYFLRVNVPIPLFLGFYLNKD